MQQQDTICAVSTPPGEGGIGIIRLSGSQAVPIATKVFRPARRGSSIGTESHVVRYGRIVDFRSGEVIDEVLVTIMRAPATYTREDVVEINCHGGMMPLRKTLELLLASGARQAEPGEFTKRAFLNGRIDLTQAEAVLDLIRSRTELALRAANEQIQGSLSREVKALRERLIALVAAVEAGVDFPEEEIETLPKNTLEAEIAGAAEQVERLLAGAEYGRIMREGFATAIIGRPNVGKSSLLNALLRQDRAIVTDVPGTTRDVIEEYLNISGALIRIVDTAGIRETHDMVEQEGVRRSLAAIEKADLVLMVFDGSEDLHAGDRRILEEIGRKQAIGVINKCDLPRRLGKLDRPEQQVQVSCATGQGLDDLRRVIRDLIGQGQGAAGEHAWAVNQRHKTALEQARAGLARALEAVRNGMSPEFISLDLREALDSVGLVVGATYTEDILERIFNDFCIGK